MEPLEKLNIWNEILTKALEGAVNEMKKNSEQLTPAEEVFIRTLGKQNLRVIISLLMHTVRLIMSVGILWKQRNVWE